jgi:hypothetical protein
MNLKEVYAKKMQAQLDEWGAEIEVLKARADKVKADARVDYQKKIEELRLKKQAAGEKLATLRKAGDGAWEDLKTGVESAWDSLGKAVKAAASRFK